MKRVVKKSGGTGTLTVGKTTVTFNLFFSSRKTLSIRLYPDQTIQVDVPTGTPQEAVLAFVRARMGWIEKHLRKFEQQSQAAAPPRRYTSGETVTFLGHTCTLQLVKAARGSVRRDGDYLIVGTPTPDDSAHVRGLLRAWYKREGGRIFAERLAICHARCAALKIPLPPLGTRWMKTRWGSCSAKGRVTLNLVLLQAAPELIDYVILHELCHLREFNHSPRFWALMDQVMPGWKPLRAALKRCVIEQY